MLNLSHWTAGVHHDGSAAYVSNPLPKLDEIVKIRLRIPLDAPVLHVFLRSMPDGEPKQTRMVMVKKEAVAGWWEAPLTISMPFNIYQFKLITEEGSFYYTAQGMSRAQKPDWYDFKIVADYAAPTWVYDAIFYQIFPDRFHNGDHALNVPEGAWSQEGSSVFLRQWGESPIPWKKSRSLDFFGGDLPGIAEKLGYIQDLGATAIYLTPIFGSRTNHRYDIHDFDNVDPHLGGNEALAALRQALDERGMHLMLDVTTNHLSWNHPWLKKAQSDPTAPEGEFFTFSDDTRQHYEAWMGVQSLVKINYHGQEIRERMYHAPDSVLRRWMHAPYSIDGWRLDVLNMTARQGKDQLHREVGREIRQAVKQDNPNLYLIGEHFYDGTHHAQGDEMDAIMNYQGFNLPLYRWLSPHHADENWDMFGGNLDPSQMSTEAMAEQWLVHLGAVPYVIALQQFNQLGSHDTWRFLTRMAGNKAKLKLATALLLTYVGVPCLYYGDEIGMEGAGDPDNRRCMIWEEAQWDHDLREYHQRLIQIRKSHAALREGGFQLLYAEDQIVAFQRHLADQRLIVLGYRGGEALKKCDLPLRHGGIADGAVLEDLLSGQTWIVHDGAVQLENLPPYTALICCEQLK